MSNFAVPDLFPTLASLLVWTTCAATQGYFVGHISNVLGFQSRSPLRQLSIGCLLWLSIFPCFYNLIALALGVSGAAALSVGLSIASVALLLRKWRRLKRWKRFIATDFAVNKFTLIFIAGWLMLGLSTCLDVQIGNKLFISLAAYDHCAIMGYVEAMARTGVPPSNACFHPGRDIPVFYHYYFALLCTIFSKMFGHVLSTRALVTSGVLFSGSLFICLIALACKTFRSSVVKNRGLVPCTILLLLVSNLYILHVLPINLIVWNQSNTLPFLSIGWWSKDDISSLLQSMFWIPHHITGLIAGILGSIILLQATATHEAKRRAVATLLSAGCLATVCGASAYLGVTFAAAWCCFGFVGLLQRQRHMFFTVAASGILALIISMPFLLYGKSGSGQQGFPLMLAVRRFELADVLVPGLSTLPSSLHQIAYFIALPMNYFWGLGFLLAGAILYWRKRIALKVPTRRNELMLIVLALTGLVLGTFVRLNNAHNDFGWRAFMLVNVSCLLWSGQYLAWRVQEVKSIRESLSAVCWLLILIGFATTIYSCVLDRTSLNFVFLPERSLALRSMYEQLNDQLPPFSVVQHNPSVKGSPLPIELFGQLYSNNPAVLTEFVAGERSGPSLSAGSDFDRIAPQIASIFDNAPAETAAAICKENKIDVLVICNTDKIWTDPSHWLLKRPLLRQNAYARAYRVDDAGLSPF